MMVAGVEFIAENAGRQGRGMMIGDLAVYAHEDAVLEMMRGLQAQIEGRFLAQRQAFELVVQALGQVAKQDLAPEFQRNLTNIRDSAVLMGDDGDSFRDSVVGELNALIDCLEQE